MVLPSGLLRLLQRRVEEGPRGQPSPSRILIPYCERRAFLVVLDSVLGPLVLFDLSPLVASIGAQHIIIVNDANVLGNEQLNRVTHAPWQ